MKTPDRDDLDAVVEEMREFYPDTPPSGWALAALRWADRLDACITTDKLAEPTEEACRAADKMFTDILVDDDMPCLDDYRRILRAAYAVDRPASPAPREETDR